MSDEKHSPGPWEVARSQPHVFPAFNAIVAADGTGVGRVYGTDDEDGEANAALIARAPDLLAEIKRLRTELTDTYRAYDVATGQLAASREQTAAVERERDEAREQLRRTRNEADSHIEAEFAARTRAESAEREVSKLREALREARHGLTDAVDADTSNTGVPMSPWWQSVANGVVRGIDAALRPQGKE